MKANPESGKAHTAMSDYWLDKGEKEKAYDHAKKALELSPDDKESLRLAAQCALLLDKAEEAREYAKRGIEKFGDNEQMYEFAAKVEILDKKTASAQEILEKGIREVRNPFNLLWLKINILIDNNELDKAAQGIKTMKENNIRPGYIAYLEGLISYKKEDWKGALEKFTEARPVISGNRNFARQLEFFAGNCYGKLHNDEQQITAYRTALTYDSSFTPAREALLQAYMRSGKTDDAKRETALLARSSQVSVNTAFSVIQVELMNTLKQSPDERDWSKIEKMLDDMEKQQPGSPITTLLRAEMLNAQEKNAEAEQLLVAAIEKNAQNNALWGMLCTIYIRQAAWDKVEDLLRDWEAKSKDSVELRLAKSQYLVRKDKGLANAEITKMLDSVESYGKEDKIRLLTGLLPMANATSDKKLVRRICNMLLVEKPEDIQLHLTRLAFAEDLEDLADIEAIVNDIQKAEGQGPWWAYAKAFYLKRKYEKEKNPALLTEALALLEKSRESRSGDPGIAYLTARIYDEKNDLGQALKYFQETISLGSMHPWAIRRSVEILNQQQRYRDANEMLKTMERQRVALEPDIMKMWATLLLRQGDFQEAMEKAKQSITADNRNFQDFIWLGQILSIVAQQEKSEGRKAKSEILNAEAEEAFRKATSLAEKNPTTWVSLVQFLNSTSQFGSAEDAIHSAAQKIDPEKAALALAQCYEIIDQRDKAKVQYEAARDAKPDDMPTIKSIVLFYLNSKNADDMQQAETMLNRILDGKVKGELQDVMWARRQMAQIYLSKGDYKSSEQAKSLIDQNLADMPKSEVDARIRIQFDLRDPKAESVLQARKNLESRVAGQNATPDERLELARLYISLGDWTNANKLYRGLINIKPKYLREYISELMNHNQLSDAEMYLEKLIEQEPNTWETIYLQSETLFHRKKYEATMDTVKSFLDRPKAIPEDRTQRIRLVARALGIFAKQLDQPGQEMNRQQFIRSATLYYRQYIGQYPSQSMELVNLLSDLNLKEEAVELLDRSWDKCDIRLSCSSAMSLAQSIPNDSAQLDRIEETLLKMNKEKPLTEIYTSLGTVAMDRGRLEDAEKYFRQAVELTPNHAVTLNNLAFLLALSGKNLDEAMDFVNKTVDLIGPVNSVLDTRACVYIARKEYDKAIADLDKALAVEKNASHLFHKAWALKNMGREHDAALAMDDAMKKGLNRQMLCTPEMKEYDELESLTKSIRQ